MQSKDWGDDQIPLTLSLGCYITWGFSCGSNCKESAYSAGGLYSIPGSGRSPGEGNNYPLQHSCLENFMDRRAWRARVHGVMGLYTTEQLTLSLFLPQEKNVTPVCLCLPGSYSWVFLAVILEPSKLALKHANCAFFLSISGLENL